MKSDAHDEVSEVNQKNTPAENGVLTEVGEEFQTWKITWVP